MHIGLKPEPRFFAMAGRQLGDEGLHILLPQTFMNLSGKSVAALMRFYKIPVEALLVVHDELDLVPGEARLKKGGGHGGHNGLKDIAAQLGTLEFWRLRLGVGHPGHKSEVSNYVLNAPKSDELGEIESAVMRSLHVLPEILRGDLSAAMLKLHTKV
jgi:PTH1 family peptidyl-tRNA hydrolase